MQTFVKTEILPPVARIILVSEPAGKPPTIDYDVLDQLEEAVNTVAEKIPEVRLLLIESSETKYFVVGANLKALQEIDSESIRPWVRRGHRVFNLLQGIGIPVVAVVRGIAAGGGLELALSCDFIYAAENARFSLPEAGLGLIPGWGGTYRLPARIGASRAKEMVFSSRAVDAPTALEYGLINFYGTEEELGSKIDQLSSEVAQNSAISVSMVKELINSATGPDEMRMQFEEAAASTTAMSSGDTVDRLRKFFEQRSRRKQER